MGELIAVLSGKGGTGKTSICAGVATALADLGIQVLCIDCDVGLRNLDISLGLTDCGSLSFLDICSGNYSFDQIPAHPQYPGLYFLTAPVNATADEVDAAAFAAMLQQAREKFHYIFLDASGAELGVLEIHTLDTVCKPDGQEHYDDMRDKLYKALNIAY